MAVSKEKIFQKILSKTQKTCLASSSALVDCRLSRHILPERMLHYEKMSGFALSSVGAIRQFLFRVQKHIEDKKLKFFDARAAICHVIKQHQAGNCEHQAYFAAALLSYEQIRATIYDIPKIGHSILLSGDKLIDPWIGHILPLKKDTIEAFYGEGLTFNHSWLNQCLSRKSISPKKVATLDELILEHAHESDSQDNESIQSSHKVLTF
jgi:hypothetical protein